jgi:uncharacterized protein
MDSNRRRIFLAVISLLFLTLFVYISHQLVRFTDLSNFESAVVIGVVLLSIALTISLPMFFWDQDSAVMDPAEVQASPFFSWLQFLAYFGLIFFNYIFFLVLGRDIFGAVDNLFNLGLLNYGSGETYFLMGLALIMLFAGSIPVLIGPQVVKVKINSEGKLKGKKIKIVQASDVHIGELWSNLRVDVLVKKIEALKPDLVVLTGDILDGNVNHHLSSVEKLGKIQSKYGTFFIPGNHEYYWNLNANIKELNKTPIQVLLNSGKNIQHDGIKIGMCGTTDSAARYYNLEAPDISKASSQISDADYKVILIHQPYLADEAKKYDLDLQLSGHTHAGQFAPWNFLIGLFQKYSKGLYKLKRADGKFMNLYVNQGTGFWGPPNRLGTICELTEITVE